LKYYDAIEKNYPEFLLPNLVLDADCKEFAKVFDEPEGCNILEIGCSDEPLSYALSDVGFGVIGIDLRSGFIPTGKVINYRFIKGDILFTDIQPIKFKSVIMMSTLEHVGLGSYGESPVDNGDIRLMDKLYNMLESGGTVYITVPVGKSSCNNSWRVYSSSDLQDRVIRKFKVVHQSFFASGEYLHYKIGDEVRYDDAFTNTGPEVTTLLKLEK
jgi:hypothetical protein